MSIGLGLIPKSSMSRLTPSSYFNVDLITSATQIYVYFNHKAFGLKEVLFNVNILQNARCLKMFSTRSVENG